jgi:hypothetical protein
MKILFLHGWQSVPGGVKPTFLAQHCHEVINPKLPDEHFEEAVKIAQAEFDRHQPDVVVGSSRGGAVAMNINSGDAKLIVAPSPKCQIRNPNQFLKPNARSPTLDRPAVAALGFWVSGLFRIADFAFRVSSPGGYSWASSPGG